MENEGSWGMENFAAVWQRVQGETAPAPAQEREDVLSRLPELQYRQVQLLWALSGRFRDGRGRELERLCAGEKRHYRRTAMEYFLRTGLRYRPEKDCVLFGGTAEGLRLAWQQEKKLQKLLASAAGEGTEDWRKESERMAAEDAAHEARLYDLIRRQMLG